MLAKLAGLLAPGGTLSFFEYVAVRKVKVARQPTGAERERLPRHRPAAGRRAASSEIRRDLVLANVPPAWVHHVRFGDGDRERGKTSDSLLPAPCSPLHELLTIETTCDETAAAVVTDELEVLSSVVASQDELHERFGGVVPEIASRAHVERILPVIDEALRKGRRHARRSRRGGRGQHAGPGRLAAGGADGGQDAVRWRCDMPLVAVNHLQAHIYACRLASGARRVSLRRPDRQRRALEPLPLRRRRLDFTPLGGTIDDAAGEAFDKVASLLGLPLSRRTGDRSGPPSSGNPQALPLPAAAARRPDAARLQLQRPEDGRALSARRRRASRTCDDRGARRRSRSPTWRPAFRRRSSTAWSARRSWPSSEPAINTLCVGGGVAANRPLPRAAGSSSAAEHGYRAASFRRCRSAPTTP